MSESVVNFIKGPGLLIVMLIAMFAIMIIPQRKRDKKVKAMLDAVKPGDSIRTIGGFYGRVVTVKENIITIEYGPDKVKLSLSKNAIATVDTADVENEGRVKE